MRFGVHFERINRIVIWIAAMDVYDIKRLFDYAEWANGLAMTAAGTWY